jgi:hypothetical protein
MNKLVRRDMQVSIDKRGPVFPADAAAITAST